MAEIWPDLFLEKCNSKGCDQPVIYHGPDPFSSEILGDDTEVYLCEEHYKISMEEV